MDMDALTTLSDELRAAASGIAGETLVLGESSPQTAARQTTALANAAAFTRHGRHKPCRMSPMLEFGYFEAPRTTIVAAQAGKWTPLVAANVRRVALLFLPNGNNAVFLSCDPSIPADFSHGWFLNPIGDAILLDQEHYGNLVQYPWWCQASTNPTDTTVIEVVLHEWPR